jgi:uncharacterized protein
MAAPTFLILPGWQNSGPSHWQSLWEAQLPAQRVLQHDWMHPLRGDWITRMEDHLLSINEHQAQNRRGLEAENALKIRSSTGSERVPADVILIAHSLGCHLVAAWASLSQSTQRIRGALLVAPPDVQRADFPLEMKSWREPVLQSLPFASICVISSNDPFCDAGRAQSMARAWGSDCIDIGARGHINAESGLGDWPQGQALLRRLAA